jgi:muramoyltetrapeptide carboxypeptidase
VSHTPIREPNALRSNSLIGVVCVAAPEGNLFPERLKTGVRKLESLGFRVSLAPHVTERSGYMAAAPDVIAKELTALFLDPDCDAVICAGGGITSNSVLPYLDFELLGRHPKIFVGASNPTTLLNAISQYSQMLTFHGPSIIWDFGDPEQPSETASNFLEVVQAGATALAPLSHWLRPGEATGRLIGGNLSSLVHLLGTRFEPSWDGGILFWEEIGDDAAHIAARLTQLQQADVLSQIRGMIVGEFVDCPDSNDVSVLDVVRTLCAGYDFPVAYGLPFGHTSLKFTLPVGAEVEMSSAGKSLTAISPCVIGRK